MNEQAQELAKTVKELKRLNQHLLFSRVARHLSGRSVHVAFRKPALKGARGVAFRLPSGQAVIHVSNELDEEDTLKVFLHEVSHVKIHYDVLSSSQALNAEPETVVWTSRKAEHDKVHQAQAKEDEVKAQVQKWLTHLQVIAPGKRLEDRLNALLKMS